MSQLNQSAIAAHQRAATANDCLKELKRENKMREINYPKWCKGNYKKQQAFEQQVARTLKLQNLFSVIKKEEWDKLNERFEIHEAAKQAEQKTLLISA